MVGGPVVGGPADAGSGSPRILEYRDPVEGFHGFCVYDRDESRLAAGGCRVQQGLTKAMLRSLAQKMTIKERVLGLAVDGAKCGIDYDPRAPGKAEALARFVRFLRGELEQRLSLGCDMGTGWHELEQMASAAGIRSVKVAIRHAQELSEDDFVARLRLLDERVGALTLGERRAGHALGCAVLAAARHGHGRVGLTCSLQGFGNLGRAAAETLCAEGIRLVAVANEHGCVAKPSGLSFSHLLSSDPMAPLPVEPGAQPMPREALAGLPADVCVLAADENGLKIDDVATLGAPVVVVGANGGLAPEVEEALGRRGVLVIPDLVGGIGGPASMEALFGPETRPSAEEILVAVSRCMDALVDDILCGARTRGVTPREVALGMASATPANRDRRPYGHSVYLRAGPAPRGDRGRGRLRAATSVEATLEGSR